MQLLKALGLFISLLAVVSAGSRKQKMTSHNSVQNYWKPTDWLSVTDLESLPAMDKITLKDLEDMTVFEGAQLVNKIYHLHEIKTDFEPEYVPERSDVPAYLVQCDNQVEKFRWDQLQRHVKNQLTNGKQEITIFMTGFPNSTRSVAKANYKLVEAFMARYASYDKAYKHYDSSDENKNTENTEDETNRCYGMLVVIDLGTTLTENQKWASLDIETVGEMFAKDLVRMTDELNLPYESIHILGQGISAHVAGAAGRIYTRMTGHQLRRITGLDPSGYVPRRRNTLAGLARGDAEFVDAIHTSVYGLGTDRRNGDVDFYPNGPSAGVPGADNVVEAAMRATRYFAESVRPGNERNFPAVAATSLEQYKKNQGNGRRAYMGIATEYDVEGDYILQVNPRSPFGQQAPAKMQRNYHNVHQAWKSTSEE